MKIEKKFEKLRKQSKNLTKLRKGGKIEET